MSNVAKQPKVKTLGIQPSNLALPASPKKIFDEGIIHDALAAINDLFQGAAHYAYWLPSNTPNVWGTSEFGVTSTGSTSYPGGIGNAAKTTTLVNTPTIDTSLASYPLMGVTGAGKFVSGNSQYLSIASSSDWNLGTENFTIDFWVRFNTVSTQDLVSLSNSGASASEWVLQWTTYPRLALYIASGGSIYSSTWTPTANTWYHIALVRSGSTFYWFVNGSQLSTSSSSETIPNTSTPLTIGADVSKYGAENYLNGWLSELRVSNTARWTSSFTPPTVPYASDGDTILLLHMNTAFTDTEDARLGGYTFGTRVQYMGSTTSANAVTSFSFYCAYPDKFLLALYSDNSGSPGSELWNSSTSGTSCSSVPSWQTEDESSGTTDNSWNTGLTGNAYYWLMWQYQLDTFAGPAYVSGGTPGSGIYLAQAFGILSNNWSGGTSGPWNWSMYLTYTSSGTTTTSTETTTTSSGTTTIAPPLGMQPCSIEIGLNGSYTYMKDCGSGAILFYATKPETIFNDAIGNLTSGGSIFVRAGTYTFTTCPISLVGGSPSLVAGSCAAIGTTNVSNIELRGEGNATILTLGTNVNGIVIGVNGPGGWYVHDLQVNGNRANQNGAGTDPEFDGIYLIGNDESISNVYEHNAKTVGLKTWGNDEKILNNWVVDSDADGIQTSTGSGSVIQGNTVNGASDVGISISGGASSSISNVLCTGNVVENVNLGVSPYGGNTGNGIIVGDNGIAQGVTISDNVISQSAFAEINSGTGAGANKDVLILGNMMYSGYAGVEYAVLASNTAGLDIRDNFMDFSAGNGINIDSASTNVAITGNQIENAASTGEGIYVLAANTLISGNHIQGTQRPIYTNGSYTQIIGNVALNPSSGNGLELDTGATHGMVSDNYVDSRPTNLNAAMLVNAADCTVGNNRLIGKVGVDIQSRATSVIIEGNDFTGTIYPISSADSSYSAPIATGIILKNNVGYNPVGKITSPISGSTIVDWGSSSSWVSGTTYTNWGSPKTLYLTGGTITAIVVDGQTLFTAATTATIILQPGDTFSVTYSNAPTITVFGQ